MRNEFARERAEFYAQLEYEQDEMGAAFAENSYVHVNRLRQIEDAVSYEERLVHATVSDLKELANLYQSGATSEDRATQILAAHMRELANKIEKRYE